MLYFQLPWKLIVSTGITCHMDLDRLIVPVQIYLKAFPCCIGRLKTSSCKKKKQKKKKKKKTKKKQNQLKKKKQSTNNNNYVHCMWYKFSIFNIVSTV